MHPVLFHFGDTAIHAYGFLGSVGFLLASGVVLWRATREGISRDRVADVIFWTSIAAIAGARGLYLLQTPEAARTVWDAVNLRAGGLVFYGAMIAALPVTSGLLLWYKLPFFKSWDIFATALPLAHAVSRVGCLMAGCCYGLPTDIPWAVTYSDPQSSGPLGVAVHPTQAYESTLLFGIFLAANAFYPRRQFDGQVALLYLLAYAGGRSVIEVFRGDAERGFVLGGALSVSQAISLGVAGVAVLLFFAVPRVLAARRSRG